MENLHFSNSLISCFIISIHIMRIIIFLLLVVICNAFTFQSSLRSSSVRVMPTRTSRSLQMINEPHGGKLINTMVSGCDAKNELIASCHFEVDLDERQLCDVELLMQGGFSPLSGYMDETDYKSVRDEMKLTNGLIFGLPVVFDTNDERVQPGKRVLLKYEKVPIAVYDVTSRYIPNKAVEAKKCYGTSSIEHPAVRNCPICFHRSIDGCIVLTSPSLQPRT